MELRRTQLLERYELGESLGRGSMGVVYQALDRLLQRQVALKVILHPGAGSSARLFQEWYLLSMIQHPNVISLYDIGEFEHEGVLKPFYAMPLLSGCGLDQWIRDNDARLTVDRVLDIIEQAGRGLHAAHLQGLVHRDVRPGNLFVLEDGTVKLLDFGIAPDPDAYTAPEQLAPQPPTPLSDLFSLGVVAYQALTRQLPFQGAGQAELMDAILHHPPHSVSSLNPAVSAAVSQVIAKALVKHPGSRFVNAGEFSDALQKARQPQPESFDLNYAAARQALEKSAFLQARDALAPVLESQPNDTQALGLLLEIGRQEQAQAEQAALQRACEEARASLAAGDFEAALATSKRYLARHPSHALLRSLLAEAEEGQRRKAASQAAVPPVVPKPRDPVPAPPPEPVPTLPPTPPAPEPGPVPTPPPPIVRQRKGPAPLAFRKILYGVIAALSVLLVMATMAVLTKPAPPAPERPVSYKVNLLASELGADIKLNGQPCGTSSCVVTLGPGNYRAEAQLAGYLPGVATFSVSAEKGAPGAVALNLSPAPSLLTISTDLTGASVVVDGDAVAQVANGGAAVPRLTPGTHEVAVRGGGFQGSLSLEIANGAAPRLAHPIRASGMRVFVVAELGAEARLYGNQPGITVTLDGKLIGDLPSQGLDLAGLANGTHELTLEGPAGRSDKLVFATQGPAAVYAKLTVLRAAKP